MTFYFILLDFFTLDNSFLFVSDNINQNQKPYTLAI